MDAVVAIYRPKPGKDQELLAVVRDHLPVLRAEKLATDRPALVLQSSEDGTVLEVFEWASADAPGAAHGNPRVMAVWGRFSEVADVTTLGSLAEAGKRFPHFRIVEELCR